MSVALAMREPYTIALFGISWFAKKRSEGNAENYALAGRKLSAPLIAVTIIGLAVGGASTIGIAENAFTVGLSAGWYDTAWAIGAVVSSMLAVRYLRRSQYTTISGLVRDLYGTKTKIEEPKIEEFKVKKNVKPKRKT